MEGLAGDRHRGHCIEGTPRKVAKADSVFSGRLYNGGRSWRAAREIGALVGKVSGGLAGYRPRLRYLLLEAQRLASADPAVPNLATALFELERCREPEEIRAVVARLVEWLPVAEARELRRAFATWLRRVLLPQHVPEATLTEVADLEEVKSMLQQNMQAYWRRAEREGFQAGQARLVLHQLEARFGTLPEDLRDRVREASSRKLLTWGTRLLKATRLEDVFAS